MEAIVTIIVAIIGSGVLNTVLAHILSLREKNKNDNDVIKKAVRELTRVQLRSLCNKYIEQSWVYDDDLEDLIALHKCYHDDLKGNGFLDEKMKRVKNLPIKTPGVKLT